MDRCIKCKSKNIYFSKKKQLYVCEDCECEFADEITPQQVFLSYGHDENQPLVDEIYGALQERGHLPWIDYTEIKAGDEWRSKITHGISDSKFFLSCISNHSVRIPGVCLDEIAIALSQKSCKILTILLEENVSVPNSISNIQWLDMHDWKEYYNIGGLKWKQWFSEKINSIFGAIENPDNVKYAGDIDILQKKLNPVSMDLKMRLILQNSLVGRKWLLDEIIKFVSNDKQTVFWLMGSPGSGKSAFSAMMSNYLGICAAVYFCQWDKVETLDSINIIKSIAFQVACYLTDYRERLIAILKTIDLSDFSAESLFEKLLVEPLSLLIKGEREKICIVLDGIDELEKNDFEFAKILNRMLSEFPQWIKFVITSRYDERLKNILLCYKHFIFSLDGDCNTADIRLFVSSRLKDDKLIKFVCEKSNGSFLLAREYVRILEESNYDIKSIDGINGAISDLYISTFIRLFDATDYAPYRCFLEVCFSSREPISVALMSSILGKSENQVNTMIGKLSSLVILLPYKNKSVIQSRHKTLNDWLVSDAANQFKLDLEDGNNLLCRFCLNELKSDFDNIDEYIVKYGLYYFNQKNALNGFNLIAKKAILSNLTSNAHRFGYKQIERTALDQWADLCETYDIEQIMAELDYATRFAPSKIIDLCAKAKKLIKTELNEKKQFRYANSIATALFYIGNDKAALKLIKEERSKHDSIFWMDNSIDSEYWFTITLLSHNLDMNEDVIKSATKSVNLYSRMGKKYYNLISLVNLFDGYMALGDLHKADEIALKVFEELNVRYYIHVDDILHICYANLLLTEGRLMEAFSEYELGISLAKDIQSWDYIYGKIWYSLALAEFHDITSVDYLKNLACEADEKGYMYLVSLAWSFWSYSCYITQNLPNKNFYEEIKSRILLEGKPGHIATVISAGILMGFDDDFNLAIDNYLKCSGGKGCLSLANELLLVSKDKLNVNKYIEFSNWVDKYWKPIEDYKTQYRIKQISDITNEILLPGYACDKCESRCCYDGVYLLDEEIPQIKEFVGDNLAYFDFLPEKYIVDGDWGGLNQYKKTAKRPYKYSTKLPSHFTQTRCVFAQNDGKCSLQTRAIELFRHPWKYKPIACWTFPLTCCLSGKILPPPTTPDEDENNIGPEYPGYASFMPCVSGEKIVSWKDYYINEIEYFKIIMSKKV